MNDNLLFYQQNAETLVAQYDGVAFESVHQDWLHFLPKEGRVVDIGAGSGRDARYMAAKGLEVYAVEPAEALLTQAQLNSQNLKINWLQDYLPELNCLHALNVHFKLILLSAVWMHLSSEQRIQSIASLASLLDNEGVIVITLRHGNFIDERNSFPVSADEIEIIGKQNKLSVALTTGFNQDDLGRNDVFWQTVVLRR